VWESKHAGDSCVRTGLLLLAATRTGSGASFGLAVLLERSTGVRCWPLERRSELE
jgi:hypothetical protein